MSKKKDFMSRTVDSSDDWETPQYFFDILNKEFNFSLDVCANMYNAKVGKYYNEEHDGLIQDWSGEICWCNPPFNNIEAWAKKCSEEGAFTTVVMILPSRTDTEYWHKYIMKAHEIRLCKGRVNFLKNGAVVKGVNFPLCIAIFKPSFRLEYVSASPFLNTFWHKLKDLNKIHDLNKIKFGEKNDKME